ncbi:sulfite exporter TauE/SafE family protein [Kiloniella sp. b19]|uniref:sulfite exporter TauE/SafE family protein n=1 Tax=Kiloniella sp. GXU_MW_B19 TaxID=3141326 RepID=UPI0031DD2694
MTEYAILFAAAFGAGALNALAGGGSFLTFPALVFSGVPVLAANATSAVSVFLGYLGSAVAFRQELANYDRGLLIRILLLSIVGGATGAFLLLNTPPDVFRGIVPWLLVIATALFAFQEQIKRLLKSESKAGRGLEAAATYFVTTYGGYFNGGVGIIIIALFSFLGYRDLKATIGLKSAMSFVLTTASVVIYAFAGLIYWEFAAVMIIGTVIGGYCGSMIARYLPVSVLRAFIILVGVSLSIIFFVKS